MPMKWITFLILLTVGLQLQAQGPEQKPLRVGVGFLGAAYQGDLTTNGDALHRFYPGMGFSLQFATEKLISPQLNAGFGRFVAQDRDLPAVEGVQPNTFVDTRFFFAELRMKARFMREKSFHPYLSFGLGLLGYSPRDAEGNNLLGILATRQDSETYGTITAAFPLSLGFEIEMSPLIMLGTEYTFRPTGSDFLDNIAALGPQSGNDKVHSLLLSLYFTFDPNRVGGALKGRDH